MTTNGRIRSQDYETGSIPARALAPGLLQPKHFGQYSVPPGALWPGSVGTGELGPGAVQAPQLAPDAVEAPSIAPGAVTTPAIAMDAVRGPNVAPGALGARELANGSLTLPKFAAGTRPVQIVDELSGTPLADGHLPGDPVVHLTDTDAKVYRLVLGWDIWNAADDTWDDQDDLWPTADWTAAVDTFDLRGLLEEGNFGDETIVARMVAANAIGATQLAAVYVEVDKWIRSWDWEPGQAGWAIDGDGYFELAGGVIRGTTQIAGIVTEQIVSSNYVAGTQGWAIDGDGNVEFNSATIRNGAIVGGNLIAASAQSANYSAGSAGWALGSNGAAEFSDVTIRGNSRVNGIVTNQIRSNSYSPGSLGWAIDSNGNAEFNDGTWRGNISINNVLIDSNGITLPRGTGAVNRLKWSSSGPALYATSSAGSRLLIEADEVTLVGAELNTYEINSTGLIDSGFGLLARGYIETYASGVAIGRDSAWIHFASRAYFRQTRGGASNDGLIDCGTLYYDSLSQKSSRHLKRDIKPLVRDALGDLAALNVCEFEYRAQPGKVRLGVIADEAPARFVEHHQRVTEEVDGETVVVQEAHESIDTSAVLWETVRAVQQLAGRVAVLEGAA